MGSEKMRGGLDEMLEIEGGGELVFLDLCSQYWLTPPTPSMFMILSLSDLFTKTSIISALELFESALFGLYCT